MQEEPMKRSQHLARRIVMAAAALVGLAVPSVSHGQETPKVMVVAGTGAFGYSGDGGPALQARLNMPYGLAISPAGLVYWSEHGSDTVRRLNADGTVVTVAGIGNKPGFSGDGGPGTDARLNNPLHLTFDASGNLYIADLGNNRVRKLTPEGTISTVAGGGAPADRVGDGGPATAARLNALRGLAVDTAGNLYIGDTENHRVRKVTPEGIISTVAGTGKKGIAGDAGPANQAQLDGPAALALDALGNLYIGEYGSYRVRRMAPDGTLTTVAGSGSAGYAGDGVPATEAKFNFVTGIAVDTAGNLFIADWGSHRLRKRSPDGILTTVVGNGDLSFKENGVAASGTGLRGPWAIGVDARGDLFFVDTAYGKPAKPGPGERILKISGLAAPGLLAGRSFQSP
jgi:sugar lactone lactonase YvrE